MTIPRRRLVMLTVFLALISYKNSVHTALAEEESPERIPVSASVAPSPIPAKPSGPLSFEEMLLYVYEHNPRLNAERDNVKIADEKVAQANAGFRPTLNADGAEGRQREKIGDDHWQYGRDTDGSLVAIQPLFNGFGTYEQKRAAEARVLAARAHLLSTEQSVIFTAITDWLDVCAKEKLLALNEYNLHRMYQYSKSTEKRFQAGDGTRTDISQAQSRLAQAEGRYASAEADRDSARATYQRDIGLPAQSPDFPPLPPGLPASREEVENLATNNPDLAEAEAEEIAAQRDIGTAESSLWPSVYLRGDVSEQRSPTLGLERLRDDSLTLNVSIPLYQGGAEYSRVREAKLQRQKSRDDTLDMSRNVLERARLSWNNFHSAQIVTGSAERASDASGHALEGVQEEQKQGLRTVTEVLDEQSELLGTQTAETEAQKSLRLEAYRLLAATGQLTAQGLRLTATPYDPEPHYHDVVPKWAGFYSDTQ